MKPRIDPDPRLLRLADLQDGVLTTEQIAGHGLGRHSLARLRGDGRWTLLTKGLYFTGSGDPSWRALAWGGVLLGGDQARLGGRAAGHLIGLNDPPATIEVLVPDGSPRRAREPWRFVRERSLVRSPRSYGSPPRPSVEDVVIDLCESATTAQIIELLTTAVQRRITTVGRLRTAIASRGRLHHRRFMLELLTEVADGAHSPLEVGYARDVERAHGLPKASRQLSARRGQDYRDVTYDGYGLVVELDGRTGHEGVGEFRDAWRDNAAVVVGELTLRYGWYWVHEWPCKVAFQVAHVLIRLGWPGLPTRCDRCRNASDDEVATWIL